MKNNIKNFTQPKIDSFVSIVQQTNWQDQRIYANFLAQTYYHILHSTRLLAAAGARFPLDQEKFHLQCMHHADEEKSHEKLSLSDLKEMGFSLKDFPELPSTKALYRSAYFLIEHQSPLAILGYAYYLEKVAVEGGTPLHQIVAPLYGAKAVKHLHVHTKEDPGHIEAVEAIMETIPESELHHVREAIATTSHEYERIYNEIATPKVRQLKMVA